ATASRPSPMRRSVRLPIIDRYEPALPEVTVRDARDMGMFGAKGVFGGRPMGTVGAKGVFGGRTMGAVGAKRVEFVAHNGPVPKNYFDERIAKSYEAKWPE